jgi:NTE family protein
VDGRRRALVGGVFGLPLGATLGGALALADREAAVNHGGAEAPSQAALTGLPARPLAWVFSTGGPRAFVHVGVVKALHELGLHADFVVGASAGSIIATLVAAGLAGRDIESMALELQPALLLRWNAGFTDGSAPRWSGQGIARWVDGILGGRPLQALQRPVAVVARRLGSAGASASLTASLTASVTAFTQGQAGPAVQASTAVEGQLVPVRIHGVLHADADGLMPLPVRLARELGAVRVLAVDASAHEEKAPPGAERWRDSDRLKRQLTRPDAEAADLLLHPDSGYWSGLSREYRAHCIATGYASAMAAAPALRRLHAV